MSAMNHDSGDSDENVVAFGTELAFVHIEKFADKIIDLFRVIIGEVFSLFEEEGGGILKTLHELNLNDSY
jgi:hypothetical protein